MSNSQLSVPDNQALISELCTCNVQPSANTLVVRPPAPNAAVSDMTDNPPDQDTIATLAQSYPVTNAKMQIIL